MKMKVMETRKRLIFAAIISLFLVLIGGLFSAFGGKERIKASAAGRQYIVFSSPQTEIKDLTYSTVTVALSVSESAFGENDSLIVSVDDLSTNTAGNMVSESVRAGYISFTSKTQAPIATGKESTINAAYFLVPSKSSLKFTNGVAEITIVVEVQHGYEFYLDAQTIDYDGGEEVYTSKGTGAVQPAYTCYGKSATISPYSVIRSLSPTGTDEIADKVIDFYASNSDAFEILDIANMTKKSGLTLTTRIPSEYQAYFFKTGTEIDDEGLAEANDRFDFFSLSIKSTTDDKNYLFINPGFLNNVEFRTFLTVCSTSEGSALNGWTFKELPDLSSGIAQLSLPLPEDCDETYYYYAEIVFVDLKLEYGVYTADMDSLTAIEDIPSYETTTKDIAKYLLKEELSLTDTDRDWLQESVGITPTTDEWMVAVNFKKINGDWASISDDTFMFTVDNSIAYTEELILDALYRLTDYENLAKFNVVYKGRFYEGTEEDALKAYWTGDRIILQAKELKYDYYDGSYGRIDVIYSEFEYKDLTMRVANNDPDSNLVIDYYGTDVVVGDTQTTITYNYSKIEEHLRNNCRWLLDLENKNVYYTYTQADMDGIFVTHSTNKTTVTFDNDKEDYLQYLSLKLVAPIVEDKELSVVYKYKSLSYTNNSITEKTLTSAPFTMWYSDFVAYNYTQFMEGYGDAVNNALKLSGTDVTYCTPVDMAKSDNYAAGTATITVLYEYSTLFKVSHKFNGTVEKVEYRDLYDNTLNYKGDYFVDSIPDGWRINNISSLAKNYVKINHNVDDYKKTQVTVTTDVDNNLAIPITVEYTDMWDVVINYFKQYKNTPFATKEQLTKSVKVSKLSNIYALTETDLKNLIGVTDLTITKAVKPDKITTTRDGDTYIVDVSYTHASLRQVDYEGKSMEVKVSLTSYADWVDQFGEGWSIMMLNTAENKYFKYSNDVERDKLYGLFSVAVFEEQVTDLNYYFKNNTGDGQMTFFEQREIKGSALYEFFGGWKESGGVIKSALGHVGMMMCEFFNGDNKIYYSHFFYLDGSSDQPFLSNGGADDAFDDDGALENTVEDVGDKIKDAWDKANDSTWMKVVKIVLAVLAVFLVIVFARWILVKTGWIKPKNDSGGS